MTEINPAYYSLQASLVAIILFGSFGTVITLIAALLWVSRDE